jgi:hypothetical protein
MTHLTPDILALPVEGVNLNGPTLADQINERVLIVFLRHFGCIFCREMVKDLRKAKTQIAGFPKVVYVYQGTAVDGEAFFERHSPGAAGIADMPKRLYEAFSIKRATLGQGFGPMVWSCALRAGVKGNGVGKVIGDPWTMPGMFLIEPGGRILWQHQFAHVGDHPDLRSIPTSAVEANR